MTELDKIRISEIFGPTIQGEGLLIGQPTVFVRTAGCDFRCQWCDTLYAVESSSRHQWHLMTVEDIWSRIRHLSGNQPLTVSLSGGNPAIQPLEPLIHTGKAAGYRFAMETQGSVFKPWFEHLDTLVVSPKPPSSGMQNNRDALDRCFSLLHPQVIMKIPVLDEADYQFARDMHARFPDVQTCLQPVNHTPPPPEGKETGRIDMDGILDRFRWLIDRCFQDQWYTIRILPQLHVLVWGNQRGV